MAGDEPRAVKAAQDILAQGGTVADAGVALALTLTVTLPSRASLGGGGACLIHNGRDPTSSQPLFGADPGIFGPGRSEEPLLTQSVEFLPRRGRDGGTLGLPTLARGLYSLHAKYGKLRWEQIVAGAENMARFGVPVSRAFVADIEAVHAEITGPNGQPLAEGDILPQGELADTLAGLRTRGAGDLYLGKLAADYVAGAGGEIDAARLRDVSPVWQDLKGVPFGNNVVYFSATPGGALAEKLWTAVKGDPGDSFFGRVVQTVTGGKSSGANDVPRHALAVADAAAGQLPAGASPTAGDGDAATGFVIVDYRGAALACTLTTGRMFGAARLIGRTGVLASLAVPGEKSDGLSGAAMFVTNENVRKLFGAFAAGGDRSGSQALVETALNTFASPLSLDQAMATARVYAAGPGVILAEPGLPLGQRQVTEAAKLGSVNGVACPNGIPGDDQSCAVLADPRRNGLTATAERRR
ncbi:MAG TPA: gamma-glutamyltransferase [Stellaceae bacterium]|nr:gamma-glutamyltransferase [Stellaceae bacterium]